MADRLEVYRESALIGILERNLTFTFLQHVVEAQHGDVVVSASMRVRDRAFTERESKPFFEGLLPEGLVRQRLAARFHIGDDDTFGLLHEIGRECAGALSIIPEGVDPNEKWDAGVDWLTDTELERVVADLDVRPLGVDPTRDIRLSLAGLQSKLVVVVDPESGAIGLPRGFTPSTHILKPAPKERLPGLVLNEAYCSVLAGLAGLDVARTSVVPVGGSSALLVERYDRSWVGDVVARLHQEDFCQALRVMPALKYQEQGGPDLRRMVDLINRVSSDSPADVLRLIQWELFNMLVGNSDGHAKNLSLLYERQNRVAPAYDLVCTTMFGFPETLSQSIGGEYRPPYITREHWQSEFRRLGLNLGLYRDHMDSFLEAVRNAVPEADEWLRDHGYWSDSLAAIGSGVNRRLTALESGRR